MTGNMKMIGITGGTGFVGRHLTNLLRAEGHEVIVLTRNPGKHKPETGLTYAHWDPENQSCEADKLQAINAMVHLAGAGIADKRWTKERKKEIVDSRVIGTRFLVAAMKEYMPHCQTLISTSAIGYYGPDNHTGNPFTEDAPPANDFLGQTSVKWEHEAGKASSFTRTVILRFGIVLGKDGGAYPELAKPMRYGIMPILGSGKQVVSWIYMDDLANIIYTAINHEGMQGIYNAVAPRPVTHKTLMQTIAQKTGGIKIPIPVPAFALKLALGEMSIELLKSCTVSAQKLLSTGFRFQYPDINSAIQAITCHRHSR
jgi:uncharacterized protein